MSRPDQKPLGDYLGKLCESMNLRKSKAYFEKLARTKELQEAMKHIKGVAD